MLKRELLESSLLLVCLGRLPACGQSTDWIRLLRDQSSPDRAVQEAARKSAFETYLPRLQQEGIGDLRKDLAAIAPALRDKDEQVRLSASAIFTTLSQSREDSADALGPSVPALLALTRDSNDRLRGNVFRALGFLRPKVPPEVVAAMHEFVRDPDSTTRGTATFVMARSFASGSDDEKLLKGLLSDPQPLIRKTAVEAIGLAMAPGYTYAAREADAGMIELLHRRLRDPDTSVVRSTIRAIDQIGPPAISAKDDLQKIVDANVDRELSQAAAAAIRRISAPPPPR